MLNNRTQTPDIELPSILSLSRDEERRRSALARHKLELIAEYKLLRVQICDVWEESGGE